MPFDLSSLRVGGHFTRPQLARAWGYTSHEAIARGVVTPAGGGYIVLFVTREKQQRSTQYRDYLSGDALHWEGEAGHGTDLRIARAYQQGEEIHLFYRDIHHTAFTYFGQVLLKRFKARSDRPSESCFS